MARVYPFAALMPKPEIAARVASVPYDVVDTKEARALAQDALSFLHVTKPEIDLPDATDPYSDAVYAQGKKALDALRAQGTLAKDSAEHFYVYELTMGEHVQTGIVLLASVEEYDQNIVRKHEFTRPDKENDRVRHIETSQAQTGKVFLVHKDHPGLAAAVTRTKSGAPRYDFTAADGVKHRLWVVADADSRVIEEGFASVGPVYIADGHHRSAAASRVAAAHKDKALAQRFLAVSFPASEVQIMPYNRVVKDLNGRTPAQFLTEVQARFDIKEGKPHATQTHVFGMYLGQRWYTLRAKAGSFNESDVVGRLDVSILQTQLLQPVLGIEDPRRDKRIDFVGGIRGDQELVKRVNEGWAVAFSLHPTSISDLFAIADALQVMPPKSTWFEPKLRDGLVVHEIG